MALFSPAQALWNQRQLLAAKANGLRQLMEHCRGTDLTPYQWTQLLAAALDFQPDLILELGRGTGNSTCVFLEAAACLRPAIKCRLISCCLSDDWHLATQPRLAAIRPPEWFAPGQFLKQDILEYDFAPAVHRAERVLVFWDAHGFDVAECVLGGLLPLLVSRQHLVLMHDMSDLRYCGPEREYGPEGLWKPKHETGGMARLFLGRINTHVGQAISILDFCTRNRLPLRSADESLHPQLGGDAAKVSALKQLLGDDLFALEAHWFWFTLNELTGPITFPAFTRKVVVSAPARVVSAPPAPPRSMLRRILGKVVRRARRVLAAAIE